MPYAGCVLLRRTSTARFQLEDTNHPGTSLIIHGGMMDDYLMYNEMLCEGRQGLMTPIRYSQFARIFNSAPGVPVQFAYMPDGSNTAVIAGLSPD
jgi:hypothetical protein